MKNGILIRAAGVAALALAAACGGSKSTPTTPTPVAATLTAPKLDSPGRPRRPTRFVRR